ncbi:Glycosyltransferase, GT2 family [Sinosporangium album]|uniref:Glycosyltransferase, GT2 family n=1 Tax=Sinosporangium album TaxID=504805 RepID=A0A1G7V1N8_9ACTN|nr:glycosyltransferase family 2 protein [Sinosporangium album]SDG53666.1 Glycosyltransferase, GT2 family [Sinosporangium album]
MTPRIPGNQYTVLNPPDLGTWKPVLRVSIVIPAYGGQHELDLVLAGLSAQTYPEALTEVLVVDNGSTPALRLPPIRPANTRLIICGAPGRANARNAGLAEATGDIVHWLDSDVVPAADAVEAHMRWHHLAPYLVVTSYLRFTDAPLPQPEQIAGTDLASLFEPAEPHAWIIDLIERTDGLIGDPHRAFSLHVGGASSVNAALLHRAGPMDTDLILGQDTELGYRLAQVGAVFVPEPEARGYHLGPTMRMRGKAPIDRVSHALVADRVPAYRWLRSHPTRQWKVPYVEVVVDAEEADYDNVRATVDAVLAGTVNDVAVVLTGPWDTLTPERRSPLADPRLDLVLLRGHYAHEGRVRLAPRPETGSHPAGGDGGGAWAVRGEGAGRALVPGESGGGAVPYRLRLPAGWVPGEDTLATLLELAGGEGYGLVCVLLDEDGDGVLAARLERTSSFARAALVREPGEPLDDAVDDVAGVVWVDAETYGFSRAEPDHSMTGRRSAFRARVEAEAEVARLKKETERLRAQVTRWRKEAGKYREDVAKWRKGAVELRRELATLRRELAASKRGLRAMFATSVKRALRRGRPVRADRRGSGGGGSGGGGGGGGAGSGGGTGSGGAIV